MHLCIFVVRKKGLACWLKGKSSRTRKYVRWLYYARTALRANAATERQPTRLRTYADAPMRRARQNSPYSVTHREGASRRKAVRWTPERRGYLYTFWQSLCPTRVCAFQRFLKAADSIRVSRGRIRPCARFAYRAFDNLPPRRHRQPTRNA